MKAIKISAKKRFRPPHERAVVNHRSGLWTKRTRSAGVFFVLLALATLLPRAVLAQGESDADALRVLSFNIRYGTANDGENRWELRRDLVLQTIKAQDADLIGLQEALALQLEFLKSELPDYTLHGAGRDDGKNGGEFSAVLYRSRRFELVDSGHLWLSETPQVPGSKGWDAALPRMVSWVRLRTDTAPKREFVFANTHFDHRGKSARLKSAELLRKMIVEQNRPLPGILTGDFNTTEDDPPYKALLSGDQVSTRLIDSYRAMHPTRETTEATFGGWTGQRVGSRIDWVLHSPEFRATSAAIDYTSRDGRYPSDHYPVQAVLEWDLHQR